MTSFYTGVGIRSERVPIYGPDFAADPNRVYAYLRQYGPIAPVDLAPGVPASLVIDYRTALEILRDPVRFPKDARRWQRGIPSDCPVLPLMMYRPNSMFTDGSAHDRLRGAVADSLRRVDLGVLRGHVESIADLLIDRFQPDGRADLLARYAKVLPVLVLSRLYGSPPSYGDRLFANVRTMFDGIETEKANTDLAQCVMELIALKRRQPGSDIPSWLMAHPAGLADDEVLHELIVFAGTFAEPESSLIANALRLLLTDDRFFGHLSGGSRPIEDALDEVLWTDPPIANYAITYPVQDVEIAGFHLPADQPVVISLAAANRELELTIDQRVGNRAHLAWSAGPHICPAKGQARLIAVIAIERVLDRLADLELAVPADELVWRPGPFHRALTALPVCFPPVAAPSRPRYTTSTRPASTVPTLRTPGSGPKPAVKTRPSLREIFNRVKRFAAGQPVGHGRGAADRRGSRFRSAKQSSGVGSAKKVVLR